MNEVFLRKNDIGVNIEYHVIGYYLDDNKRYRIYTDFVTDKDNIFGIRIMVDLEKDSEYVRLNSKEEKVIFEKYNKEIMLYAKGNK